MAHTLSCSVNSENESPKWECRWPAEANPCILIDEHRLKRVKPHLRLVADEVLTECAKVTARSVPKCRCRNLVV